MEQRVTFCPYCGARIAVTLAPPAQITVAHGEPLCPQALGIVEGLTKAVRRLPMASDFAGRN